MDVLFSSQPCNTRHLLHCMTSMHLPTISSVLFIHQAYWLYCNLCSFLGGFSTFFVRITLNLLGTGAGQLWDHLKYFVKAQKRPFLWTLWIFAKRMLFLTIFSNINLMYTFDLLVCLLSPPSQKGVKATIRELCTSVLLFVLQIYNLGEPFKCLDAHYVFICSHRMHRQPEHVMTFLLAEMGTSGSLDGQQRLVVKGRFAPKNFEGILRRYISKFSHCFP